MKDTIGLIHKDQARQNKNHSKSVRPTESFDSVASPDPYQVAGRVGGATENHERRADEKCDAYEVFGMHARLSWRFEYMIWE